MHLWPTVRLRESFKKAYLDKMDFNFYRMKREKENNHQKLLDSDNNGGGESSSDRGDCGWLREILVIVSCCYCCFCCGACVEEES